MINGWLSIAAVAVVCVINAGIGYSWTQLDHNPWSGKFLGGRFSGPTPGWNPAGMTVEEIRRRGRALMMTSPFLFVCAVLLIAIAVRTEAMA